MVKVLKEAFHAAFMLVILPFVIILASSLLNGISDAIRPRTYFSAACELISLYDRAIIITWALSMPLAHIMGVFDYAWIITSSIIAVVWHYAIQCIINEEEEINGTRLSGKRREKQ